MLRSQSPKYNVQFLFCNYAEYKNIVIHFNVIHPFKYQRLLSTYLLQLYLLSEVHTNIFLNSFSQNHYNTQIFFENKLQKYFKNENKIFTGCWFVEWMVCEFCELCLVCVYEIWHVCQFCHALNELLGHRAVHGKGI